MNCRLANYEQLDQGRLFCFAIGISIIININISKYTEGDVLGIGIYYSKYIMSMLGFNMVWSIYDIVFELGFRSG